MPDQPKIPLPDRWRSCVKSAVLQVISLARFSMAFTRGWAADGVKSRMRLKAENERLREEINLLRTFAEPGHMPATGTSPSSG